MIIEQEISDLHYQIEMKNQQPVLTVEKPKIETSEAHTNTYSKKMIDQIIQLERQKLKVETLGVWAMIPPTPSKEIEELKYNQNPDVNIFNQGILDNTDETFDLRVNKLNEAVPFPAQLEQIAKVVMKSIDLQTDFEESKNKNLSIEMQTQLEIVVPQDVENKIEDFKAENQDQEILTDKIQNSEKDTQVNIEDDVEKVIHTEAKIQTEFKIISLEEFEKCQKKNKQANEELNISKDNLHHVIENLEKTKEELDIAKSQFEVSQEEIKTLKKEIERVSLELQLEKDKY